MEENNSIMGFEEFAAYVEGHILKAGAYPRESTKIKIGKIVKNNGIELTTLEIFEEGVNMAPVLILNDHFEDYLSGRSVEDCIADILELYEEFKIDESISIDWLSDYNVTKRLLYPKVINRMRNAEYLKDLPYFEFGDLAVVFQVLSMTKFGLGGITVTKQMLSNWNVTTENLMEEAAFNMQIMDNCFIASSGEYDNALKADSSKIPDDIKKDQLYFLTNDMANNGAAALLRLDMIQDFTEKAGQNVYIVPVSISDYVLILDDGFVDINRVRRALKAVNRSSPRKDTVLSNSIYYYNRKTHKLINTSANKEMILKKGA